ncbi:MAG TPA: hypothetical protein VGK33_04445, partial [Chloroflexota bacterium]
SAAAQADPLAGLLVSYLVSLYAKGSRFAADCLPEFYETYADAVVAGGLECLRVKAIPPEDRVPTIDWAHRFTIRKVRGPPSP